jgi:hypothetical protein
MDAASRGGEAEGEAVELEGLNAAYEAAFPGLRYVYVSACLFACMAGPPGVWTLAKRCGGGDDDDDDDDVVVVGLRYG